MRLGAVGDESRTGKADESLIAERGVEVDVVAAFLHGAVEGREEIGAGDRDAYVVRVAELAVSVVLVARGHVLLRACLARGHCRG
jgi:hypothetical protein